MESSSTGKIDRLKEKLTAEERQKLLKVVAPVADPPEEENITELDNSLSKLEALPEKERRKYFNETALPLLAATEPIERAQATKKASALLSVSMEAVKSAIRQLTGDSGGETNQADALIEIATANTLFHDDLKEPYILVEFDDHNKIMKVGQGKDFTRYISGEYYKQTGNSPYNEAIRQAINVVEAEAVFKGKEYKLELRVDKLNGAFWYDLADEKNRAIFVNRDGWQIINRPPILFRRRSNQDRQIEPVPGKGNIWLLSDFINTDEDNLKLLLVYLVTCLIPEIPHVIPIFHGEKGAAKSTTMQFIRRLIDPAKRELFTFPKDQNELALQLYGNYMPCYDNLSGLSQMQSDVLCGASTGGGISKRTLYSNDDDTILKFFCCPILNGINVVAHATDLLDRCMIFELQRIPEKNRKEMSKVFADFEKARPAIFTGLLDALSKAMKLYPSVNLTHLPRMADFARWGYAIAEVLGISGTDKDGNIIDTGGNTFMRLYRQNMAKVNAAAIDENAVATAIVELMSHEERIDCTATELLDKIYNIAEEIKIDTKSKYWPKDASVLSKRIMHIKSNLLDAGIRYDTYRLGGNKGRIRRVTLERTPNLPSPASPCPQASNGADFLGDRKGTAFIQENLLSPMPSPVEVSNIKARDSRDGGDSTFRNSTKSQNGVCPAKEMIEF